MRMIVLLLGIALSSPPAFAQMYKWVDKDGKTNYTDSPPPDDAKKVAPPKGATAPTTSAAPQGKGQRSFRSEEQTALQVMCGIAVLEVFRCQLELKRWCSLDELVKGFKGDPSTGLGRDPRNDPNYDYRVEVRGDDIRISALPRTPGLAGFSNVGDGTHYNFGGAAGTADPKVTGGTNCAADFKP